MHSLLALVARGGPRQGEETGQKLAMGRSWRMGTTNRSRPHHRSSSRNFCRFGCFESCAKLLTSLASSAWPRVARKGFLRTRAGAGAGACRDTKPENPAIQRIYALNQIFHDTYCDKRSQ